MIDKLLNNQKTTYSSDMDEEGLRKKIESAFEQESLKLVGKFTSNNEFTVYDKWIVIAWSMPNFKRKSAYLKGELMKSENGTLIQTTIKPNSIIAIFPILSVLIGLTFTLVFKRFNESNLVLIIGLLLIAMGIIYYLIGLFFINRLRKNFEKCLYL